VVFIRAYEFESRRLARTSKIVSLGKSDLALFLTGSVIFFIVTLYGVVATPQEPLSTISDLLQITSFIIAFVPFVRKLWQKVDLRSLMSLRSVKKFSRKPPRA